MEFPGEGTDHVHDLHGGFRVEISGRLVGKHHVGPGNEGAGDSRALLLAARHLAGEMIQTVGQPHAAQKLARRLFPLCARDAPEHQRHRHVFRGRQVRQKVIRLKHKAEVALPERGQLVFAHPRNARAPDFHLAARWLFHARELIEQRAFSRSGRSEDTADLPAPDPQVDSFERHHRFAVERVFLAHVPHLDDRPVAQARFFHADPSCSRGASPLCWVHSTSPLFSQPLRNIKDC